MLSAECRRWNAAGAVHCMRLSLSRRLCCVPHNSVPINYEGFDFEVLKEQSDGSGKARRCIITTPHGQVQTPAFVFCATKAAIKGGMTPDMVEFDTHPCYHCMN